MAGSVASIFQFPRRRCDWSSQELAEFYRVEGALSRAGIALETERGLSDEGDPWFVFCRADTQDVIVHFARDGGECVVASPTLERCLRGRDLRRLIEDFLGEQAVVVPAPKRDGKVLLHPAALMIALITTCFFKMAEAEANAGELAADAPAQAAAHAASPEWHGARQGSTALTLQAAVALAIAWVDTAGVVEGGAWERPFLTLPADEAAAGAPSPVPIAGHAPELDARPIQDTPSRGPEDSPLSGELPQPHAGLPAHVGEVKAAAAPQFDHMPDDVAGVGLAPADAANHTQTPRAAEEAAVAAPPMTPAHVGGAAGPAAAPAGLNSEALASTAGQEAAAIVGDLLHAHVAPATVDLNPVVILKLAGADAAPPIVAASPAAGDPATAPAHADADLLAAAGAAIQKFVAGHADFQVVTYQDDIIFFDPDLKATDYAAFAPEVFNFADHSSIVIIGVADHHPPAMPV